MNGQKEHAAGDLADLWHSDGTTGATNTYDRRGRLYQQSTADSQLTSAYNDANELLSETYTGGPLDGVIVTNTYDSLLRRSSLTLNSQLSTLNSVSYGYDGASRLSTVTNGPNTATYTYLANSMLVSNIVFKNGSATRMTTTKAYDNLNRLSAIASSSSSSSFSSSYQYNLANQRTAVTNADNSRWVYQYDTLGQVISGTKYWNDGTMVAGQQFDYTFDDIGNRKKTIAGGNTNGLSRWTNNYTANLLNQYTDRTVSGTNDIVGAVLATNFITVNGTLAYQRGEYFQAVAGTNNTGSAAWLGITVASGGVTNTGNLFVVKTPETFGYDADGNLTNDGRWIYSWDAENRLTNMTSLATSPSSSKLKLDFAYDWKGRRIQKIVSAYNGSAYVGQYTNRFVYDGWNLIATLNPQSSILQSYVWGLDLSSSMQGAGGVGGLLMENSLSQPSANFVAFDGNGNVAGLVNTTNGTISANYEYGPFGEVIRATGPMARVSPFRWSTQYTDDETDLVCYLHRYYNPSTGRWLSRDPIGEAGGRNLYAFLANRGPNAIDWLGLCTIGHVRNPKCEITVTDSGNDPSRVGSVKGLEELAGETELFAKLFGLAETIASGGTVGIAEAVEKAAEKVAEEEGRPDVKDMAKTALSFLKPLGAWRGYTPFTRIKYERCNCGGLFRLYRNYWADIAPDKWDRYDGPSDLGLGTFLDRLSAVRAGSKQCTQKLKEWKEANKNILDE